MTNILTVEQVAAEMQVSEKTVYSWIRAKRLRATNIGTRRKANYRVLRADLDAFIANGATAGEEEAGS